MSLRNKNIFFFVHLLLVTAALQSAFAFRTPENPQAASAIPGLKIPKPNVVAPSTPADTTVVDIAAINAAAGKAMDWAADKKVTDINIDCSTEDAYWYNPSIHGWGNVGLSGAVHAVLAPLSTWIIDRVAYDGEDVRSTVSQKKIRSLSYSRHSLCLLLSHSFIRSLFFTIV